MRSTSCPVFNQKIHDLRVKNNYTQKELAEKAGISLSTVRSLEKLPNRFDIHTIRNVAEALNVTPGEIIMDVILSDEKNAAKTDSIADNLSEISTDSFEIDFQEEITARLENNRHMIDKLLTRYQDASSSGQFDCSVTVEQNTMIELKLLSPLSMPDVLNRIMWHMQAIATYDKDEYFMTHCENVIHWICNVLYTQPRNILTSHVDRERLWTFVINSANEIKFEDDHIRERYIQLVDNLTTCRFAPSEERVLALLQLFFFIDENWKTVQEQSDAYVTLSLILCLFENDPIASDDWINLDRAATVILIFLNTLVSTNAHKPYPVAKDKDE